MQVALVSFFCVLPYRSNISKIVDALTLDLLIVIFSVNFKTILWACIDNPVFKIESIISGYSCSHALDKLER